MAVRRDMGRLPSEPSSTTRDKPLARLTKPISGHSFPPIVHYTLRVSNRHALRTPGVLVRQSKKFRTQSLRQIVMQGLRVSLERRKGKCRLDKRSRAEKPKCVSYRRILAHRASGPT